MMVLAWRIKMLQAKDWANNWFDVSAVYPTCFSKRWYVNSLFGGKFLTSSFRLKYKTHVQNLYF
jgi:hypothetical protein